MGSPRPSLDQLQEVVTQLGLACDLAHPTGSGPASYTLPSPGSPEGVYGHSNKGMVLVVPGDRARLAALSTMRSQALGRGHFSEMPHWV